MGADTNCNGVDDLDDLRRFQEEQLRKQQEEMIKAIIGVNVKTIQKSPPPTTTSPASLGKTGSVTSTVTASAPNNTIDFTTITAASTFKPGGNVISPGGANVISPGGGNLIGAATSNLIGQAGSNVISPGGGNLIGAATSNLLPKINIGAGVISPGGANVISPGGANLIQTRGLDLLRAKKPKTKTIVVGTGGLRMRKAGKGKLKLVLNASGKKIVAKYLAQAKVLHRRHRKVPALVISYTRLVGPINVGSAPAVMVTRKFVIRG
jgi:hypothetical protein